MGIGAHGTVGVRKCLAGIASTRQNGSVISKDGGAVRLEAQRALEVLAGLYDAAMVELEFTRNEVRG